MLNERQLKVINATEPKIIVQAASAAGKTATLTAQVKKLINDNNDPSKIVVITFTNAAADEMKDRIGKVEGLFIGTIHSYACFLLNRCGVSVKEYIENEDFDKFFLLVEKHPECIREVEYLLLDEAQDTGKLQLQFILEMIKPKHWTFYGDIRQSIYSWNGARPDLYKALMRDPEVKVYTLNQNYRNGVDILSFAKTLIDRLGFDFFDDSEPMRDEYGEVTICNYSKERILDEIMERPQYGDWFILTRSNAQLEMIKTYLEKNDIPCSTFKRSQLTKEEFSKEMKANTVKVLTIHTSKGLENKNVIVIGAKLYQDEEVRLAYVAATRARDYLVWMMPERKKNNKTKIKSWE